jgi:CheY-like chemotaxis protein
MAASERAANLVHGLLAFSRKQVMNPRPIDLDKNIKNVVKLLSRLLTEDIDLRVSLSGVETVIMADPGQIDQILMNLVTNASDAMPKGGLLTIETSIMKMDVEFLKGHGFGARGPYVMLSIQDTGEGMDEQTRQRIFEPFYTTKPMGKGTGLGLSIVYGIVKQHGGFIEIQSNIGEGTTFRIYFPLIAARIHETTDISKVYHAGGGQTILVADDDTQVRSVIKIILGKSGYKVLEAEDGEMAVRQFENNLNDIDLLILDIVMPRKNGLDAYGEISKLKDDAKVIFISGYTADVIDQKGAGFEEFNLVAKPISPNDLLLKVRDILGN